jgi:hypothetical protein
VRFVVDKVALRQVYEYFGVLLWASFDECCIIIFIRMLIFPEGQWGEDGGGGTLQKKRVVRSWIKRYVHGFYLRVATERL